MAILNYRKAYTENDRESSDLEFRHLQATFIKKSAFKNFFSISKSNASGLIALLNTKLPILSWLFILQVDTLIVRLVEGGFRFHIGAILHHMGVMASQFRDNSTVGSTYCLSKFHSKNKLDMLVFCEKNFPVKGLLKVVHAWRLHDWRRIT